MTGVRDRPAVAVFGGSEPPRGSAAYRQAYEVGRSLAAAGLTVINGGYGGVMEASARGAREAGGATIGVTTSVFRNRAGANRFVDTEVCAPDLFDRTRRLIEPACGFIVLRGRSGTLAELAFLWALRRAGLLGSSPIVLLGRVWEDLLHHLRRLDLLDEASLAGTTLVHDPSAAVEILRRALDPASGRS